MVAPPAPLSVLVANPFAVDPVTLQTARDSLGEQHGRLLEGLLDPGRRQDLERGVLAVGHLQACASPGSASAVLGSDVLPRAVESALPRPRAAYLAVVMAAARCRAALDSILGGSPAMQRLRRETWAACFGDSLVHALNLAQVIQDHDVLILGETGTGKEGIAHAIQEGTPGGKDGAPASRSALNAAAVPATLVESELFGHVKGAFTGASESRAGRIRSADHGCFFLDEVGDLEPTTQVKLLRVIETDEVSPLGSDAGHEVQVRYVAATHKDLSAMVAEGRFRQDLYQRLAGSVIRLPALRDRPADIIDIGMAFVARHLAEGALPVTRERTERWLGGTEARRYAWPGNVRELQNALRNLLLGLEPGIGEAPAVDLVETEGEALPALVRDARASLKEVEDWYLRRVLAREEGNLAQTARVLGVDRTTVRRKARRMED